MRGVRRRKTAERFVVCMVGKGEGVGRWLSVQKARPRRLGTYGQPASPEDRSDGHHG